MNRLRAWIRSFFGFSRTETNAFLIMLPLMAIIVSSTPLYRWWSLPSAAGNARNNKMLDSLVATWKWEKSGDSLSQIPPPLFVFNPNKASLEDLTNLGFSKNLSNRIIKYRAKGGKFKIKHDLDKIYGMDSSLYLRLVPFIDLPEKITSSASKTAIVRLAKKIPLERFDLNLADTSQLIKIDGIGPKLSLRITAYRNRLGGFVSLDQLREVYGLDSAVIHHLINQAFIQEDFRPRQLNINTADEKKLSSLPYLKFALAKSIAVYRFQHGEFSSVEGLKKIALMDETTFQKIKPYITVKD